MPDDWVPDRLHPGYQRPCVRPDCPAACNALDVMLGLPVAAGWRQFRGVILGQVCPDHAGPVISGEHAPAWQWGEDDGVTGIECACGWSWQPPEQPATQGDHQDQWVTHLMEATDAR